MPAMLEPSDSVEESSLYWVYERELSDWAKVETFPATITDPVEIAVKVVTFVSGVDWDEAMASKNVW